MLKAPLIKSCKLFFIMCCYAPFLFSQKQFDVKNIPPALKEEADAVIRLDETIFTIENIGRAKMEKRLVVTVFNQQGEDLHADFREGYDKLNKIKKIQGTKYDADGYLIGNLKSSDIKDIGLSSFGNDIFDGRVKVADFGMKQSAFPYTIDYSYEIETQNMMFYPTWYPYGDESTSLEKSTFVINAPENLLFRYKELNGVAPVIETRQGSKKTYTWSIANLPAYQSEAYAPRFDQPFVITAPIEFEVEGYHGNLQSWSDVGKFYFELNKERDILPEAVKTTVKNLTQNEKDVKTKIEKLYEYLQSSTHYMNISLGIGGWQTMEAKAVSKMGYGDCKALSNYMKALLKEAGIPAYQALIYAGDKLSYSYPDFACMHFNHVITCVPLEKDTLFLECTSQTNSLGYQGSFTGNRKALLIMPDGGKLVNTVAYAPADNAQLRKGVVRIDEDGNAEVVVSTTYTGIQQERRNNVMNTMNKEDQKNWLIDHITIPSFELQEFSFSAKKARLPEVEEKLKIKAKKLITQSGPRLFLTPNLMTNFMKIPFMDKERKSDLFLTPNAYNFHDADTLTYELPKNYEPEFLPEPVKISSKFGEYTAETIMKDGKLMYYRNVVIKSGTYPKADYKEWAEFIKKVLKSDRATVVFTQKK